MSNSIAGPYSGIWYYGLSGSGKTRASKISNAMLERSFLLDGDNVRQHLSYDLGYSPTDRSTQLNRMLGLTKIVLENGYFPLISSVTMTEDIFKSCIALKINVIEINRNADQLLKVRSLYQNDVNVVGKDIPFRSFDTLKIYNCGTSDFDEKIREHVDQYVRI